MHLWFYIYLHVTMKPLRMITEPIFLNNVGKYAFQILHGGRADSV